MIKTSSKLFAVAAFAGAIAATPLGARAAADDAYTTNDILLFFQNPAGTTGTDKIVYYSLGSTFNVFRDAATSSSLNFGATISLGNINSTLTTAYGSDWTGASASIFAGAAGQNGATSAASTAISNEDYARTVYITELLLPVVRPVPDERGQHDFRFQQHLRHDATGYCPFARDYLGR